MASGGAMSRRDRRAVRRAQRPGYLGSEAHRRDRARNERRLSRRVGREVDRAAGGKGCAVTLLAAAAAALAVARLRGWA